MVFQSSQISGMVGGQMAMFANQHAFSQQIGAMAGTGPQTQMGGIQNPYPQSAPTYALNRAMDSGDLGSRVTGGLGMAIPGVAAGASLAGGLIGGRAGWMDPFVGMGRSFSRGVGTGGLGARAALGTVGQAFTSGGIRAGGALLAGGLGAAAATAVPYYLAGKAISGVGENLYQGAQNITEVGQMAQQHFGSQMGAPGSRPGGLMGRDAIKGIVGSLHELVGEDTMRSMESLKGLMDKAGRMGMLTGITDAQEFKQRFGKIVNQVQDIAKIMGTSLDEAIPMFGQMKQMGLWRASDVMGATMAAKMAGPAAPQLMQTMASGAQMSHAMGGTRRAGTQMGRSTFEMMQSARRSGVLSEEDVMEFTGGLGGAEGQAAVSRRMMGIMGKFGQTSAGRLMMAGLGETEEGKFTGSIDPSKLRRFQSGEFDVQDLQRMGMKATRGREGSMSFYRQSERLGQELGAQGGIEAMTQIVQQIADTRFKGSDEARHQLLQQMLGVGNREAEMLGKLADKMPQIMDEKTRRTDSMLRETFQRLDERQNRSWEGLSDAVSHAFEEAARPIQEFAEGVATDIGKASDDLVDKFYGRVRAIPMGSQERIRLLRQGALSMTAEQAGVTNLGQSYLDPGFGASLIEGIRGQGGAGALGGASMGTIGMGVAGAMMGTAIAPGIGTVIGGLGGLGVGAAASLAGLSGRGQSERMNTLASLGLRTGQGDLEFGATTTSREAIMEVQTRAIQRARGITRKNLGVDTEGKRDAMETVKATIRKVMGDRETGSELRRLKRENPRGYTMELVKKLREKGAGGALKLLRRSGAGGEDLDDMDTLSVGLEEEHLSSSSMAPEFEEDAKKLGVGLEFSTMKEVVEAQNKAVDEMVGLTQKSDVIQGFAAGQLKSLVGAAEFMGFITPAEEQQALKEIASQYKTELEDVSREDISSVMTGPNAALMQRYLKGEIDDEEMSLEVQRNRKGTGGEALENVFEVVRRTGKQGKEKFAAAAERFTKARGATVGIEQRGRMRELAKGTKTDIKGLDEETAGGFRSLVERYKRFGKGDAGIIREDLETLAGGVSAEERAALSKGGGAFGRQVAGLSKILGGDAGAGVGVMDEDQTQTFLKELKKVSGLDVETMGSKELKEKLKEGVTEKELPEVQNLLKNMAKNMVTETKKGMEDYQTKMANLMSTYVSKHTMFVQAVDKALGTQDDDLLKESAAAVIEAGKGTTELP